LVACADQHVVPDPIISDAGAGAGAGAAAAARIFFLKDCWIEGVEA